MKKVKALIGALALSCLLTFPSYAGQWKQDAKGWWYQNDDDSYKVNEWYKDPSNGSSYHFETFGYMNTGKTYIGEKWYYFLDDGRLWCNYKSPDGFVTDNNGEIVYPDAPGIIEGDVALGNKEDASKFFVVYRITNFSNYPLTVDGEACIVSSDFESNVYMIYTQKERFVDSETIQPNEEKILAFVTPDFKPVNYKLGETLLRVELECNGANKYLYSTIYDKDTWNGKGEIAYCKP